MTVKFVVRDVSLKMHRKPEKSTQAIDSTVKHKDVSSLGSRVLSTLRNPCVTWTQFCTSLSFGFRINSTSLCRNSSLHACSTLPTVARIAYAVTAHGERSHLSFYRLNNVLARPRSATLKAAVGLRGETATTDIRAQFAHVSNRIDNAASTKVCCARFSAYSRFLVGVGVPLEPILGAGGGRRDRFAGCVNERMRFICLYLSVSMTSTCYSLLPCIVFRAIYVVDRTPYSTQRPIRLMAIYPTVISSQYMH